MNFPDRDPPLPAVSAQTLARWLGVSPKVVYDLTKVVSSSTAQAACTRLKIACGVTVITFAGKRHSNAASIAAAQKKAPHWEAT